MTEIQSKPNVFIVIIITLGIIGFSALSYFLISNSLSADYPQIAGVLIGSLFGLFALLALLVLIRFNQLLITPTHLHINYFWGTSRKIIPLKEISSYIDIKDESIKHKTNKFNSLFIFYKGRKYKIESSAYSNYQEIRRALIKGKAKNKNYLKLRKKRMNKIGAIVTGIFSLLILLFCYHSFLHKDDIISKNSLSKIKGTIINKAEIKKGSKGKRSIKIKLKEYPKFSFTINGISYKATHKQKYISNVSIGDSLFIDVLTDEYQKKILQNEKLSFWDKSINYHFIGIFAFKDTNNTYLSLIESNNYRKKDANWIWLILVFGLYMAWEAYKFHRKS